MAAWDYTNDYSSTLAAGYSSNGTTLTVASSSGLPTSGRKFILRVDNEYLLCTSYSGGTLTVVGAQGGSAAANHNLGAIVNGCWLISTVLDGVRSDASQIGAFSSLPSSGMKAGDRYKSNDGPYDSIYDGSNWNHFYQGRLVAWSSRRPAALGPGSTKGPVPPRL